MLTRSEAFSNFGSGVIGDIIKSQNEKGLKASGKSAKSLRFESGDNFVKVFGSDYFYYQEYGRGAGKRPPISKIKEWIEERGLKISPWVVANKIGLKGTNIFRGLSQNLGLEAIIKTRLAILNQELNRSVFIEVTTILKKI
jgi:hypothetical protein